MDNPTREESVLKFLEARKADHPNPAILEGLYGVEIQVNVHQANGELGGRDGRTFWTDGTNEWFNLRVDSKEKAEWQILWPLCQYADAVGASGWSYRTERSLWVGYDFDSLAGHAEGVGISKDELDRVREAAIALPYVEARRSTGGRGLHLVVHFADGILTQNRAEHKALARCVLGKMSTDTGFEFVDRVDHLGEILWLWARRASREKGSFQLIKPAQTRLTEADLPGDWRDHVDVVCRRRSKVRIAGVDDTEEGTFAALTRAFPRTPLDETHKTTIDKLAETGFSTVWAPDHHLLQTHTKALEQIDVDRFFRTNSRGTDPATPNCFAFPMPKGAWKVYRFSRGVSEAVTWEGDRNGWTWTHFNREPDLATAARALGGGELPDNKGFQFDTFKDALPVVEALGQQIEIDDRFHYRETILRTNKDGRLVVRLEQKKNEQKPSTGWVSARGGWWEHVFRVTTEVPEGPRADADHLVRRLQTPDRQPAGYVIRTDDGWTYEKESPVGKFLLAQGYSKGDGDRLTGTAIGKPWRTVCIPFADEYPGGRQWNLHAPQLRFRPADVEHPQHPSWDKVLGHLFRSLDDIVQENSWCREAGIVDGGGFGRAWTAAVIRHPFTPTPYLFFVGGQDCGKSTFHESLELLFTSGVTDVEHALKEKFNSPLEGCVVAALEEVNLGGNSSMYNRVKQLVTARTIRIRRMFCNSYEVRSTLHFVHTANSVEYCPAQFGDTRIMVLRVPDIPKQDQIGKDKLLRMLEDEAPQFLTTLARLPLPEIEDRMRIPVLETDEKKQAIRENEPILFFIENQVAFDKNSRVAVSEVYEAYKSWAALHSIKPIARNWFGRKFLELTKGKVRKAGKIGKCDAYEGLQLLAT